MPYQRTTVYDTPEVLASMLVDGEFTARGASNAMFDPTRLSVAERDDIRSRLKAKVGHTGVGAAVVDAATDPFVWLFLLTSPAVTAMPLAQAWNKVGPRISPYLKSGEAGLAKGLSLLTHGQVLRGSPVGAAAIQVEQSLRNSMMSAAEDKYAASLMGVVRSHGLDEQKMLDWHQYTPGPQRDLARRINAELFVKLNKADQLVKETRVAVDPARDAAVDIPAYVTRGGTTLPGVDDLANNIRELLRHESRQTFKDPNALVNVMRGSNWYAAQQGAVGKQTAKFARDVVDTFEKAGDPSAFAKELHTRYTAALQANDAAYLPRNVRERWQAGKLVGWDQVDAHNVYAPGVRVRTSGSVLGRTAPMAALHPEDLKLLDEVYGLTPDGKKLLTQQERRLAANKPATFQRMNVQQSVQRYTGSMRRTRAMFVDAVSPEVRAVHELTRANVPVGQLAKYAGGGSLEKSLAANEMAGVAPKTGYTLADVMEGELHLMRENNHAQRTITQVVLPHLMGTQTVNRTLATAVTGWARGMTDAFVESGAGHAMRDAGGYMGKMYDSLHNFAKYTDDLQAGGAMSHNMAKWLYASHLGFNASSAIVNALQPLTSLGVFVGHKHLPGAYKEAFSQMGKYLGERAASGFKILSVEERDGMIRKHFPFWQESGLSGSMFENLERMGLAGEEARKARPGVKDFIFEGTMKLFEKVEWLNRTVAANAVASRWAGEGKQLSDPLLRPLMKDIVQETQFGGHWMNKPAIFTPGAEGIGALGGTVTNPLLSQFMGFLVRSFTAATVTGPSLGGLNGIWSAEGAGEFLRQTAKGIGASSLMVYAARDLMGADLERGGYVSAITEALPFVQGGRFNTKSDDFPVPMPPIVGLAKDAALAFLEDDKHLLTAVLPRLIPGGLQMKKLLEVSPPVGPSENFRVQQRFVDWNQAQKDAQGVTVVPVYDRDKGLLAYQPAVTVIARAFGTDLGQFNGPLEIEKAAVGARQETTRYKQEAVSALGQGNISKYQSIRAEYLKRFKLPLVLDQGSITRETTKWNTPRVDRTLSALPNDVEAQVRGETGQGEVKPTGRKRSMAPRQGPEPSTPDAPFRSFSAFDGF